MPSLLRSAQQRALRAHRAVCESCARAADPSGRTAQTRPASRRSLGSVEFTSDAEDRLAFFADQLRRRAIGKAIIRDGTVADIKDVNDAQQFLMKNVDRSLRQAWQIGVGGVAAGVAATIASNLIFIAVPPPHVGLWWLVVAVLTLVSVILMCRGYQIGGASE
jgi:hypothetical protein